MRILFTGGGTGGHFYPIIAVAEEVNHLIEQEKIIGAKLYFMSDSPYDKPALFENSIEFEKIPAGKVRLYNSTANIVDKVKIAIGVVIALVKMFFIYPDVVFSKGGYASFPALFAARILRIPVIIHDSDSIPGRVSLWSSKFAERIAISYDVAAGFFSKEVQKKIALTGQPIRKSLLTVEKDGAFEYLRLDSTIPTIFILGGSLGSENINNVVLDALPELLEKYQIIHQVGLQNITEVESRLPTIFQKTKYQDRYKYFGTLSPLAMKMAAGASTLIISRAGSTIFEIANWGIPSIIIPIPETVSRDQHKNSFAYARSGSCIVIEEANLAPSILLFEVDKLINNSDLLQKMSESAHAFARPNAAQKIAQAIIDIAITHEI
jgi:UDP-N-acetylglucosamine--N-acetylmuramyl-(pentapeptide) pyrophosphoryl-undecaprenol N-acetylglucosamine transferase